MSASEIPLFSEQPLTGSFDFTLRTRIVFGPNRVDELGKIAAEFGGKRVLVVSDPGVAAAGHTERGSKSLREAGAEVLLFDGARENPTTDDVDRGLEVARSFSPDLLVGLGGGSSMDCAKGINFLFTNGGRMQDYWGVNKASRPMLPMIAVPTTAGTGSELQSFALISDAKTHVKMACGDYRAACRVALLDPTLTLTQPARVTALTGVDAVSHVVETYVTRKRNPISMTYSWRAWSLLTEHLPRVLSNPADLESRGGVQLGASLAGLAIENSMLGIAHSLANPLTATYDIPHGQAVGVMLPFVVRYNAAVAAQSYGQLAHAIGLAADGVEPMAQWLTQLLDRAGLATNLSRLGVDRAKLPDLAQAAHSQWTRSFNPRNASVDDLFHLYEDAF